MNAMTTTIDAAGRIVIPKAVRDQAGLAPGVEIEVQFRDGRVELEPVCATRLERRGSLLVAVAPEGTPPLTNEQVNRTLRQIREKRD